MPRPPRSKRVKNWMPAVKRYLTQQGNPCTYFNIMDNAAVRTPNKTVGRMKNAPMNRKFLYYMKREKDINIFKGKDNFRYYEVVVDEGH